MAGIQHEDIDHTGLTGIGDLAAHTGDTSDAHDASAISFSPAGSIAATDVQAAIEEVASEAAGGSPSAHGFSAYKNTTHALSTSGEGWIVADTDEHDTDAYHFLSDSALTGTVAKVNGSTTITGTGTSFTTELSVGQFITVPGTQVEIFMVTAINSNTDITVDHNAANGASGQTATRRSAFARVPTGLGGKYRVGMTGRVSANTEAYLICRKNSVTQGSGTILLAIGPARFSTLFTGGWASGSNPAALVAGDTLEYQGVAQAAANLVPPSSGGTLGWLNATFVGT